MPVQMETPPPPAPCAATPERQKEKPELPRQNWAAAVLAVKRETMNTEPSEHLQALLARELRREHTGTRTALTANVEAPGLTCPCAVCGKPVSSREIYVTKMLVQPFPSV